MIIYPLPENPALRVLSLGAGVQSTVMALMADESLFGAPPDLAIFADTQWEPAAVYEHLEWLKSVLSYPVEVVIKGDLRADTLTPAYNKMPVYRKRETSSGMAQRQCTAAYKIKPIEQAIRRHLGFEKGQKYPKGVIVEQWLGISTDEIIRAKNARHSKITNRFPLIEIGFSRANCEGWFQLRFPDRKLVKSACIGCPFHNDHMWREMRDSDPVSWANAVDFDKQINKRGEYLHRQRVPLDQVDLTTLEDHGQLSFLDECEGMCGV